MSEPSFEAIAYGLLWRSLSDSSLVKTARHALRSSLSKEEQKAGIAWVVENHGPVTTADMIAADIRCGIFPERSYDKEPPMSEMTTDYSELKEHGEIAAAIRAMTEAAHG